MSPKHISQLQNAVLIFLGIVFLLTSLTNLTLTLTKRPKPISLSDYSYKLDDYPHYYPLDTPLVSMTPEDSTHYHLSPTHSPSLSSEWSSIFPKGGGFIHLGPSHRPFGLSMFHQMHCLVALQQAIEQPDESKRQDEWEHSMHCLNYMREMILCDANPALERSIPEFGERAIDSRTERVCKDWETVYRELEDKHHTFQEWLKGATSSHAHLEF